MSESRRVHLFIPCFVDQIYPQTGMATVKLLQKAGCDIFYPQSQTCCGQPAYNSGYWKEAKKLAERFVRVFANAETVVSPSASCVSMVKDQYQNLDLSGSILRDYEALRPRVFELSEFLVDDLKTIDFYSHFPHKVAYHTSCHGYRELNIHKQPVTLLENVRDIDLVELDDRKQCCGFGGTFSVKFPEISTAMGEDKLEAILKSKADVITATDDSCLMHISGMLARKKIPIRTYHYARILAGGESLL